MANSSSASTRPELHSVYICLITLELASIGIKYQGLNNNPFQESNTSMLLFLTAIFCHAIALIAKHRLSTVVLFHASGVTACETLLWILVAEFLWCIIINVLLFLVAASCFYYKDVYEVLSKFLGTLGQEGVNADQTTDLEAQEGIGAQTPDLGAANAI